MEFVNRFVAIDLETTGLHSGSDKITEIALVRYENGIETESFETLINPGVNISEKIVELTGITDDMVKDSPYIDEVLCDIENFLKDDVLVGHSLMFDYSFLKKAMVNGNKSFEKTGIDTLKLSRILLSEFEHKNLDYICDKLGINDTNHHRAGNDARAAAMLLLRLLQDFGEKNKEIFEPHKLEFKVKKEGPITKLQLKRLNELIEKHGIEPDYELCKLTKNEASRKIDKIYLQYGRL